MVRVREIVRSCGETGIRYLTLYAFSRENWRRPASEVNALMKLLRVYIRKETPELMRNNVRLRLIGRIDQLPAEARKALQTAVRTLSRNTGLTLVLALNYGGRTEILDAVRKVLRAGRAAAARLNEDNFSDHLYTAGIPDPDLLIRTSGEIRVSNFLLWQIAYTEMVVTPVLWPDFDRRELDRAIDEYRKRERRFGGVGQP
jgi:undecaprenyl diphosphate synthase